MFKALSKIPEQKCEPIDGKLLAKFLSERDTQTENESLHWEIVCQQNSNKELLSIQQANAELIMQLLEENALLKAKLWHKKRPQKSILVEGP